jgi:negative regulator of sigma-B (phosphoserine phosphatase)
MGALKEDERAFGSATRVEWAAALRPRPGETESGDLHVVQPFPGGTLLAAVDGLGHGAEAAAAARAAVELLRTHAAQDSVISLVRRCQRDLQETRGVVMSLASFSALDSSLTWLGIGNVEGVLVRADPSLAPARESLLLRGGVVGYRLPTLSASVLTVNPGDVLAFATDGVDAAFTAEVSATASVQPLADRILSQWGKTTDDALVLVARFTAEPA